MIMRKLQWRVGIMIYWQNPNDKNVILLMNFLQRLFDIRVSQSGLVWTEVCPPCTRAVNGGLPQDKLSLFTSGAWYTQCSPSSWKHCSRQTPVDIHCWELMYNIIAGKLRAFTTAGKLRTITIVGSYIQLPLLGSYIQFPLLGSYIRLLLWEVTYSHHCWEVTYS